MQSKIRFCKDIGMHTFDRGRISCRWSSGFCRYCYNGKLYLAFPKMFVRDEANEQYWDKVTPEEFTKALIRRKMKRFRFCSRGEIFDTMDSLFKAKKIIEKNPGIKFWIPTRAWRPSIFRAVIENDIFPLDNAYILASIDPETTQQELGKITQWRTLFFGDNIAPIFPGSYKCPKTWQKIKGICDYCNDGCFNKTVGNIWLKTH